MKANNTKTKTSESVNSHAFQQSNDPLFYQDLKLIQSDIHKAWKIQSVRRPHWLVGQHVVPLLACEFADAARHYPIIFSDGPNPVPLALMGLCGGVNVFVNPHGAVAQGTYVPAYVRRYPFLLARIPGHDELTLCFDAASGLVGKFRSGTKLFHEGEISEDLAEILSFCEEFEQEGRMTQNFLGEVTSHGLLIDGEVSIKRQDQEPYVFNGFRILDQNKLADVDASVLQEWVKWGLLDVIYSHLRSLEQMNAIFELQLKQGNLPTRLPQV